MKRELKLLSMLPLAGIIHAQSIIWQNTYGGVRNDFSNTIQLSSDNTFVIAGSTDSPEGVLGHMELMD